MLYGKEEKQTHFLGQDFHHNSTRYRANLKNKSECKYNLGHVISAYSMKADSLAIKISLSITLSKSPLGVVQKLKNSKRATKQNVCYSCSKSQIILKTHIV